MDGFWSPVHDWPLITVHAALTPDGRVLTYGTNGDGTQTGFFIYDIWDPEAGLTGGHMTLGNMTLTDIFCSSQIILPQTGDILIAGGDNWTGSGTTNTGNNNSNIFDYGDNTLARSANMHRARWYSSATALLNGEIYIQGGTGGADLPEVRRNDGSFRLLTGVPTSQFDAVFPRNYLAPDGRVFGYDTNARMYFITPAGTGSIANVGQFSTASAGWTSGAAMFEPGKILQVGAGGSVVIDITGPAPRVTATQPTSTQRRWVSATVLPDGQVLATGGSRVENQLTDVNNFAEIWNPATGTWHVGAEGALARLYHSSGLLLPDGSVLVSGGGAPGPLVNTNAEIYYPPYLFNASGAFAIRPQIVSAPTTANVGDNLAVQVTGNIGRVTMVKSGSTTHSVNMDQRFVELPFTASANMLDVRLPIRASDTPPGYYMLFVINDAGVPSVASMLRINIDPTPNTAVDYTPTIGGGGGAPFRLACPDDEIVVGVHGNYATYVNQVGAQCVKMDQLGRWIGNPVNGAVTGTNTGGTPFTRTCPRDYAVSGFRGRSDQYVNQIEIQCRALTPDGALAGDPLYLGGTGGPGGNVQAPLACGTGNPVHALYGRSGSWLDSFGVECKTATITPISINSSPVAVNPGAQTSVIGVAVSLQIEATDSDGDPLTYSATGLPSGLQIDPVTGRITGAATATGDFNVSVTVSDGSDVHSVGFPWTITLAPPLSVNPMPAQPARPVDTSVGYTASASGGTNVVYKWNFGDGSPETAYSASASTNHTFTSPGLYFVTLTVNDAAGVPVIDTFLQRIHLPLTATRPTQSTKIAYEQRSGANSRVWVVNQDNDSVSVFDAVTNAKLAEIAVGSDPRSLAIAPDGRIWVTNRSSSNVSIVNAGTLSVAQTLSLPHAALPYGIAFSPVANQAYVVLEARGQLLKLDGATGAVLGTADVGPHPRHVAVRSDGARVFVSRFKTPPIPGEDTATPQFVVDGVPQGGEIRVLDAATLASQGTIVLRHSDVADAENQGRGIPNYVGPMTISPDGTVASVPSKLDNIARGTFRDGLNLNFQNTVRAVTSYVNIATETEMLSARDDHDNASLAAAVAYDPYGLYEFVALETSREVVVLDAHSRNELFRIGTGRAPQGLALSPNGNRLFVSNFMDRTVGVYDLTAVMQDGQWNAPLVATLQSVANEALPPQVLVGKQFFYDAADDRLAFDNYLSCASCHNEGDGDGRVWDLTGFGEGLRNTISLRGRAGAQGRLHWSQNFDEVQDFEGQIRTLSGGTGLMANIDFNAGTRSTPLGDAKAGVSAELDALAAYVQSLDTADRSPHRNADGTLTPAGVAGKAVFEGAGCADCHSAPDFTDSAGNSLHDIGTLKPSSGTRLGQALTGIDTPTLRGAWATAPYLHDGSAATIADAILEHDGVALASPDLSNLVAYVLQIDSLEVSGDDSLIGYWPMNEGSGTITADASGNGRTGTLVNGTSWAPGPGLNFDGTNDYVDVGNFDVAGNELTLAAMVRSDQLDNCARYNDCRIISKASSTSESNHYFMLSTILSGGETRLRFRLKTNGTTSTLIATSGAIQVDRWTHVAAVYDGQFMRLYVDGVAVGSTAKSGDISANPSVPVWIGANPTNATQVPWDGQIDEVRVYDRALTAQEILELAGGNAAPQAQNQAVSTPEDTARSITLSATDADGDPLTYSIVNSPSNGTLSGSAPNVVYTPGANFTGADSFTFRAADNWGGVGSGTVTITVTPVNDPPAAAADAYSLTQGQSLVVGPPGVLANDSDIDGDALSAVVVTNPGSGSLVLGASGSIQYTPNAAFVGVDSFTYRASDGQATSAAVAVTLTVNAWVPPNVPPVANNQSVATPEDTPLAIVLTASDADGDPLTYQLVAGPANGALGGTPPQLTYTPAANFHGADSFSFRASDGEDPSNVAVISINVAARNDAPVASNGSVSTGQDTAVIIILQGSDVDGDALTYRVTGGPGNGELSGSAPSLVYTPDPGFVGDDTIDFEVDDGNGGVDSASIAITVLPTPDDLVGHWPMSEGSGSTTADATGNGRTGTLVNGALWAPDRGIEFDGVNDYVNLGNFDVAGNQLTVSAWVLSDQLDNCARHNDCRIISKATSTSSNDHYFMVSTIFVANETRLRFRLKTGGSTATLIASTGALTENRWTHVAAVYDGSFMRLYLDGIEVGATSRSGDMTGNPSVPVWIGANPTNASQVPWDGRIDDVRIYDRAFSPAEIYDLATQN